MSGIAVVRSHSDSRSVTQRTCWAHRRSLHKRNIRQHVSKRYTTWLPVAQLLFCPPTHNREPYDTRTVLSNIMFL